MVSANEIFNVTANRRKDLILGDTVNLDEMVSGIDKAREVSRVLNNFLPDYFILRIEHDDNREGGSVLLEGNLTVAIDREIELFKPFAIAKLTEARPTKEALKRSSKNLYEMSGAEKLSYSNKVTRNLSTTMGLLWERLASISPYAINPEIEFNIKVKGIDLIATNFDTGDIEYQQLKTQHNTLTGSQQGRSAEELQVHDNPVFCACLSNNSSWTFNHPDIPRVSGENFWSRIGIPYGIVLPKVKELILDLEKVYVSLL